MVGGRDRRYDSAEWRRLRRAVLERDLFVCQMRGPRCRRFATDADHVIPVVDGGAFFDPGNVRAACRACNGRGGALLANRQRGVETVYQSRL